MIIAVDIDNTITAFPDLFKFFFKAYQDQGAKVGIITVRPEKDKEVVLKALEEIGINPDFFIAMPDKMRELEFSSGIFKALVCNYLGVDVLYDDFESDDNGMMGDFFTYNQKTKPFTSFAYNPEHSK